MFWSRTSSCSALRPSSRARSISAVRSQRAGAVPAMLRHDRHAADPAARAANAEEADAEEVAGCRLGDQRVRQADVVGAHHRRERVVGVAHRHEVALEGGVEGIGERRQVGGPTLERNATASMSSLPRSRGVSRRDRARAVAVSPASRLPGARWRWRTRRPAAFGCSVSKMCTMAPRAPLRGPAETETTAPATSVASTGTGWGAAPTGAASATSGRRFRRGSVAPSSSTTSCTRWLSNW